MSQPSLTILLLTAHRLVRADFGPTGSTAGGFWMAGRSSGSTVPDAVREALALGGRPGRSVWVLCEEAWTQSVDLASGQVRGLAADQIGRALSFEVEPFSGVPVGESALGFRESDDRQNEKSYWIVEIAFSTRDAVQRAVAAAGGRLAGVSHPGGVPQSLNTGTTGSWRRLEVWNGSVFWSERDGRQDVRTRVLNSPPATQQGPAGSAYELLCADHTTSIAGLNQQLPWERFSLEDEAPLRAWLGAWAATVRGGHPPIPFIAPAAPKATPRKYILTGVLLEAAVLALGFFLWWSGQRERADLRQRQAEMTRVNQRVQEVGKENMALRKDIEELEIQTDKREELNGRRGALPALLRALAANRPDDVVLSSIHPGTASGLIVTGLALEAISVDEMSMILTETLRPAGWFAQPLQKVAKGTLPNAGPWEFSIGITQEAAKPATKKPLPRAR